MSSSRYVMDRFPLDDSSSDEPQFMQNLTEVQKEELGSLLEQYLVALESGVPPTVEFLTRDAIELREPLRACIGGLADLHRLAGGDVNPITDQETDEAAEPSVRRLGAFELHEELGRGGMGIVYRATQQDLKRTVAIKVLPLAAVLDPRQLTRFRHEAEAAASLLHPNIVPVFAVGCEQGIHFYVMQYINGQSVAEWIADRSIPDHGIREQAIVAQNSGQADWRESVRMAADVADGLHAAHELGIIHRDIKPSNLLLDESGKVWIADFGLARIQSDNVVTQSGDVLGTLRYMSPEQARGESAIVDGRSDVYALAATLYEMLTHQPAHRGDDVPALHRARDEDDVVPLRRLHPFLPRDLGTVVGKAMSLSRDGRYETAAEFSADLRRVLSGEPTVARPPTLLDRVGRTAYKYRTIAVVVATVGLLAVIGTAAAATQLAAAKNAADAHAKQSLENERIARDAIDRLGSQIAELLSDIPAAKSVRFRLLRETIDYYKRFAEAPTVEGISNHRRVEDLAVTYGKMGLLQLELGRTDDAIDSLQQSERLYERLIQRLDCDLETTFLADWQANLLLDWSISQNNLAEAISLRRSVESASDWFSRAIATQTQLHHRGNPSAGEELAKSLNNLGGLLAGADEEDVAKSAYNRAIELLVKLDHTDSRDDLRATIESNLAGVLTKSEPDMAIQYARQAITHQLQRLEANASDPKRASQVVVTLHSLADAQVNLGLHREAIASLRQAIAINRQLRLRWPDQLSYRRDLVVSLNHLGMTLAGHERLEQAEQTLTQAVLQGQELKGLMPQSAEVQCILGGVLNNLGFVKEQIGDARVARQLYEQAVGHHEQAVGHQREAMLLAPTNARGAKLLKRIEFNLQELRGKS